ncbi:hypothetical protein [Bacillus sp. J37]|uniref:hypothetical protein n=1 Tax=Bacillus sp. J37 TaxID=935837 RepID=UPI0012EBA4A5|nr:hypothetical protein [Bacillus sp. J37]
MTIREDVSDGADEEIRSLVEAVYLVWLGSSVGRARTNKLHRIRISVLIEWLLEKIFLR